MTSSKEKTFAEEEIDRIIKQQEEERFLQPLEIHQIEFKMGEDKMKTEKEKTEQEWLDIYHDMWNIFGNNNVRLTLGKFSELSKWGKIEIVGFDIRYSIENLQKIIDACKKYGLRINLDREYGTINLYEDYSEGDKKW